MPATPATGNSVTIADGNNWETTNLTVGRNGSTIESAAEDLVLDIANTSVEFIYSGTTWQVYAALGSGPPGTPGLPGLLGNRNLIIVSANTSAFSPNTYVITTTLNLTLPPSPASGDYVGVINASGNTDPVIIRNGNKINGVDENMTIDAVGAAFDLTYIDATRGWWIISN